MSSVPTIRSVLALLRSLLSSRPASYSLRRLVLFWLFLKRQFRWLRSFRGVPRGGPPKGGIGRSARKSSRNESPEVPRCVRDVSEAGRVMICASRRPHSTVDLRLSSPSSPGLLQAEQQQSPQRPVSLISLSSFSPLGTLSPHSPRSPRSGEMLHPYSFADAGASRSDIAISVISGSTSEKNNGRRTSIASRRHDALPTSRATARGITRVASRATTRGARTRSHSRAPSRSPRPSFIDLPYSAAGSQASGSQRTVAVPAGDVAVPMQQLQQEDTRPEIYPIMVVPRYDRGITIQMIDDPDCMVPAMTLQYSLENVPSGWEACTHPEGALYFYHQERRIYTDANICDTNILDELNRFADLIDIMVHEEGISLPPAYELVLELEERKLSGGYNWCYYFVDHRSRALFWIQDFDACYDPELQEVKCKLLPAHMKHHIEGRYWQHLDMFPHNHKISEDTFTLLMGLLLHANIDRMTSLTSTVAHNAEDLHRMLGLVKIAKSIGNSEYATCIVGRLMYTFAHERFLNFAGLPHARLSRDQNVFHERRHRTPLIRVLSLLFFNAPKVHLRGLEKIWIDGIIAVQPWSQFIGKLQNEWQEFVLYSTVLLNANVAFLAIPGVSNMNSGRTPAQVSSYLSVVTSVGSIILGLLLVRQHRVKPKDTAKEAVTFLTNRRHPTLGLETLAIIYSLPYALLMWAMITFLLAFAFECFFDTDDVAAIYMTGATCIAVAILVIWCIYTAWESGEVSAWETMFSILERVSSTMKEKREKAWCWNVFQPHVDEPSTPASVV